MADCPQCGASVAEGSRYCAQCGRRVDDTEDNTVVEPLPLEETGHVPVERMRAEPRLYGVTPTALVLALAVVALTLAIVFFVLGRWPLGLVLLGIALLLLAVFVETARRLPGGRVTRASAEALDHFRARTNVAAGSLATRGRAMGRVLALRRELRRMQALRARLLFELGDAVYRGDDHASETARGQLDELDGLTAAREAEMHDVVATARRRIDERRLEVQPTEVAELPSEPGPGEVTPPEPAVIPEPYPPPDEATPPQPAIIPEPGPAVIPEPGPEPQTPEPQTPERRS